MAATIASSLQIAAGRPCISSYHKVVKATFLYKGFDEIHRLGLQSETMQMERHASAQGEIGMLVVDSMVPGGPGHNLLEPEMNGIDVENHQENAHEKIDYVFKVGVIGDLTISKTQILSKFTKNEFCFNSRSTIGLSSRPGLLPLRVKSSKPRSGTLLAKKGTKQ
ncbi:hypothetical protein CRYUN_Cryun16bG0064200 [Craigia yunnanensis]